MIHLRIVDEISSIVETAENEEEKLIGDKEILLQLMKWKTIPKGPRESFT